MRTITRRDFLGQASCAAVGSVGLLSTLLNLRMANSAMAQTVMPGNDYRALVCLFLSGGIDSFNVLFPAPGAGAPRTTYETVRGGFYDASANPDGLAITNGIALASSAYGPYQLAIHPAFADHAGTSGIGSLFGAGKAAFVTNVGTLVEPTTKAAYNASTARRPRGLYSHSDQVQQWHTSVAVESNRSIGWAGRAADLISSANTNSRVSMNISLAGRNVWQSGTAIVPYTIGTSGSSLPSDYQSPLATPLVSATDRRAVRTAAIDNLLQQEHQNLFDQTFAANLHESIEGSVYFRDAFSGNTITTLFPGDTGYAYPLNPATGVAYTSSNDPARTLGQQLKAVVRTIKARGDLSMRRQTFFVQYGGWDHHDEVINSMQTQLDVVNRCLAAYWQALVEIGMTDAVTLYTASDFARTLTSNGAGSDHAWGGNQLVLGGSVQGNKVYGSYPDLALAGARVVTNRGALIPDISVDQYFAELALWFGISPGQLADVLPRIGEFYVPGLNPPVGFMTA
jgi:uncharacterized protein (DUF1501 family)